MSSKRKGSEKDDSVTSKRTKKMSRSNKQQVEKTKIDRIVKLEKIEELKIALGHSNHNSRVLQLIKEVGADVDSQGHSILSHAIRACSSYQLIEELLLQGAHVNDADDTSSKDDIFWAACFKPQLLPKLITHQVPDEQKKNQRGVRAMAHLIYESKKYPSELQIIKSILDQGVSVNTITSATTRSSLLSSALRENKKDVVALLLGYGADIHCLDEFGHNPIYLATRLKGSTKATRLLIQAGASIHEKDDSGRYPIHGACEAKSFRNIHLLLSLGADINVTDDEGYTPYDSMDKKKLSEAGYLVIKHFALIEAKGKQISDGDMAHVNTVNRDLYRSCMQELTKMKVTYVCDGVPYFSLLSENMHQILKLMRKSDLIQNFKRDFNDLLIKKFPIYFFMLLQSFEIAESQYKMYLRKMNPLYEALQGVMPSLVIDKIAHYLYLNIVTDLHRCQYEYYMSLHKSLKNKRRIL